MPTPALVALGATGAILSLANGASQPTAICGLILAACTVGAATAPVTCAVIAWLTCAWSLMTGHGVDLPVYLLVGVPLWAVARHSATRWIFTSAAAAALSGFLAAGYAVVAPLQVRWLIGLFRPFGWTLSANDWSEALLLAFPVWLTGGLFLGLGLATRGMEVSRRSRDAWEASQARSQMLDAQNELAEERARISREMHDIVGHSLSVMIAQADGGRYAAAAKPEAAVRALEAIAQTGRDALADMRGIVRVLREGPEDQSLQLKPTAHVKDLEELVQETRKAGLDATLIRVGKQRNLPPGVGATLYRVAQEALTNTLKHAGPNVAVTITERWDDTRISITVSDDGRGAAAHNDGAGHGLVGMRERAEMLGGVFQAGPGPAGGFTVTVSVPIPGERRAPAWRLNPAATFPGAATPADDAVRPPAITSGTSASPSPQPPDPAPTSADAGPAPDAVNPSALSKETTEHGNYSRAGGR
ncbi:MAG: sensor histidine kinase [Bifidobacteriaceae bacterium]|jgi:signal transduction histidine kinase|nr:sensor histidine kinase [Bifidobacteriaceae bacterium]